MVPPSIRVVLPSYNHLGWWMARGTSIVIAFIYTFCCVFNPFHLSIWILVTCSYLKGSVLNVQPQSFWSLLDHCCMVEGCSFLAFILTLATKFLPPPPFLSGIRTPKPYFILTSSSSFLMLSMMGLHFKILQLYRVIFTVPLNITIFSLREETSWCEMKSIL